MHPRGPLIGRDHERAAIDQAIEAARAGRGGLVLVAGGLVDPDRFDTIQVEAAWGDPRSTAPTPCSMSYDQRHFRCEHAYPSIWGVPRTYHIGLRAIDEDGGMANHQTSVRLP